LKKKTKETKKKKTTETKKRVIFRICAPEAGSVSVAGSFNGWNTASHPLKQGLEWTIDGVWQRVMYLGAGVHEYRFIVDGSWQDDPSC
jgi:1,4-alpha-glucan branching enzyme